MADITWNDDEHYMAEAETEDGLTVIMLWKSIADHITVIKEENSRSHRSRQTYSHWLSVPTCRNLRENQ